MLELSEAAARALLLAAQGLHERPARPAVKEDVLAAIRRMGALQIDTIHVVARSPYLVLWSRLGSYQPRWLDELLAEGAIFEYWSHAASFLPIEDFGLYRRRMLDRTGRYRDWLAAHPEVVERVLGRINEQGATRSADFERTDGRAGAWWDWKPEKQALECLFTTGELMVSRRERFQRIYDLRERVLPDWDDARTPSREEVRRAHALAAVRALGVAKATWVPDYFRIPAQGIRQLLEALADEGALIRARVEGWPITSYIHPDNLRLAESAVAGALRPALTTLLSPFDPVVWHRARAEELFGFAYRIETYTPAARRRYGYFSLPILHRDQLVGRLDPKAHRREGRFEVRALHLEPGVRVTDDLICGLAGALRDCAEWHGTPEVAVLASDPPDLAEALRVCLQCADR